MTYRELLNKYSQIPAKKLFIASLVNKLFIEDEQIQLMPDEYEKLCSYIYDRTDPTYGPLVYPLEDLVNFIYEETIADGLNLINLILNDEYEEVDDCIYDNI